MDSGLAAARRSGMTSHEPPRMTRPAAAVEGVTKHFGATVALDGVDFDVAVGEIHAVVGENGADPIRHHAGARCFAGNFLFSTGPNSQGGGKRTTKGHYDVPMRDCTVALDNDVIIERGKITDEKMQVAFVPR